MNALVATYLLYALAAILLTGILARTLFKNGKVFLAEVFDNNAVLATAINTMLVTGFYMLNLGYAFLIFRTNDGFVTTISAVENLVTKLGLLLLSLGVIHFVNMGVFWRIRNNAMDARNVPATFTTTVMPPPPAAVFDTPAPY